MGQMAHAVIYGVHMAPPATLEEGWWTLIERYERRGGLKPVRPCGDGSADYIGFWCAVGGSGEWGYPFLDDFPLNAFRTQKAYKEAHRRAVEAWEKFARWCLKQGISLPAPRLYLVQTEVA
jgi:hypothetical protein